MTRFLAVARHMPTVALSLALGVALRESYRTRRSIAETTLPQPGTLPTPAPRVSIVLPVRDEEDNIDGVLATLLAQDYPDYDVTVIDDGSTDATPHLLEAWAARDPRLRAHRVEDLPSDWAGKTHALHTGVGLTEGEWLLFTDADTRHAPETLRLMLGHAVSHGDDLLSMFTDLRFVGLGMRLLTPIGALLLIERATAAETRDRRHRGAIANGQYLLVRRAAYNSSGGYAAPALRRTFADDVVLAEFMKRAGSHIDIVGGRGLVTNRQWTTWDSAWRGWRKSVYGEFAPRPLLGFAAGLTLIAYGLVPSLTLLRALLSSRRPHGLATLLATATVAAQVDAHARFDREFKLPFAWSLTAPAGWVMFGLLLLDTIRLIITRRGAPWKNRTMPRS